MQHPAPIAIPFLAAFVTLSVTACGRFHFEKGDRPFASGMDGGRRDGASVDAQVADDAAGADAELADAMGPDGAVADGAMRDGGVAGSDAGLPAGVTVNRRSIGTHLGSLYGAGTVDIALGATALVFSSSLPTSVGPGDRVRLEGGDELFILDVSPDRRSAAVQAPAAAAATDASFIIERSYAALADWETDRQGDLVADNRLEVGVAYNDGPFTSTELILLDVDGSVTDADHFMLLTVGPGQGHRGVAGSGVVIDGLLDLDRAIAINDDYVHIDGVEIRNVGRVSSSGTAAVWVHAANALLTNLIVHHSDETGIRTTLDDIEPSFTVRNTIVYANNRGISVNTPTGSIWVDSCTVHDSFERGVICFSGMAHVTNTLATGSVERDFYGDCFIGGSHNASADATAPGPSSQTMVDAAGVYVNPLPGAEDFHLRPDAFVRDRGLDRSAVYDIDIDRESRPRGSWDIGADEAL